MKKTETKTYSKIKTKTKIKEKAFTIKIAESEIERLDFYCKKAKINRSQLTRNLIGNSLDELDILNSTGFLALTLKGIDLFDIVKTSFRKKNYSIENEKLIIDL